MEFLPNEIIGEIFASATECIAPYPSILLVSKLWNSILWNTPQCWSRIRLVLKDALDQAHAKYFTAIFRASGTLPARYIDPSPIWYILRELAMSMCPALERLSSLQVSSSYIRSIESFLASLLENKSSTLPLLRSAIFRWAKVDELEERWPTIDGELLESLTPLERMISITPNSHLLQIPSDNGSRPNLVPPLDKLEKLVLCGAGDLNNFSAVTNVFHILAASSNLRRLQYVTSDIEWVNHFGGRHDSWPLTWISSKGPLKNTG